MQKKKYCRQACLYHADINLAVGVGSLLRPVHVALPPAPLHQVGDHDDHVDPLLPHHAPERFKGVVQWSLGA